MTISGDVFAPGGSTPATYANINTDAGRLSNGGTVLSYLKQYAGDTVMWDPWPAYDGVIRVLAPDNGAVTTISIQAALGSGARGVADLSVEPLVYGGFVVAWTDYGDVADANSWQVHYAVYDNGGTLQSGGLLSSAHGHNVRIASLADGGFATVFAAASGSGGPNQQGVVNVFSHDAGSGGYVHQPETYVGDPNSNAPGASVGAEVGRLFLFDELSITALSSGGFVVGAPTYDLYVDNGQTHTPVGDFLFNYSSTGQQEAFASGVYWQRVNWNPGQIDNAAVVTAYSGGFASLNRGDDGNWQVTLFHDDGSLVTSTAQTASVYHGGTYVSRTYYATDLGPVSMPVLSTSTGGFTNLDDFVALVDAGSKLIAVLPNAAGGFDFASISKSTGALLGIADSGIEVPPGAVLANPRLLAEGGGFDFTYDLLTESGGYVLSSTYQIGLDAPPPNTAPVIGGIDGDAAQFVLGRPEYIDVGVFANVYDTDSPSFDGGWLEVRQVSGSADGSFGFDRGVGVTQILWGSGAVPDTANDGVDFTAAAAPAVGDKVWYSSAGSPDPATWALVGTIVADGQNGSDLRIAITNTSPGIPNTPGDDSNYASLLLKYLMYTAPTLGARGFSVSVNDGDGATSTPVGFTMSGTSDATSAVTAAAGVAEPVRLPAAAASAATAVAVLDFTVTDGGSGDGLATRIKTLSLDTAGSGDFGGVTWLLSGPGIATPVAGTYDGASHKLVFDNAGISVADGAGAVYTVKAYFADPAAAVAGNTYQLSLDGTSGVTLEAALSSQMAAVQTPVGNGSGTVVVTSPTVLAVQHAAPPGGGATNADTLSWTVRFSEAVQNLDAADFDVLGLSGETITVAGAGGNAWTVGVSGGGLANLDGSVTLALAAGQDIVNADAQPLAGLAPSGIDGRSYLLDNSAPAAPGLPTLATDSGSSSTDGRTNVTTPTFTGSAEDGASVTLYDDNGAVLGTGIAAGGTWTIVSSLLAPGAHGLSVRAVDAAGNESAASAALAVVIDTAAAAPGLALAADTGRSASDGLTRDGRMTVTLDADVDGWEYSVDGGAHWSAGSGSGFTLGEAGYAIGQVQVRQRDTAGNLSPVQANAQAITVDTSVAAPAFALVHDTGSSAVDGITADGTIHVDLAGDAAGWEASVDGGAHWRAGSVDSFVLPAGSYEAGSVLVRQRDIAGSLSAAAANTGTIVVKTEAAAPSLALADDTGSSALDGITKNGTVSVSLAADTVSWAYRIGSGAWSAGSGTGFSLGAGIYEAGSVQVRQTDLAGNLSAAAANGARIVVDQSVGTPAIALVHDSGVSALDGITADGSMQVTLDADAAFWEVSVDGGAHWSAGSRTGFSLAAGSYAAGQLQVRQLDTAGNLSAAGVNAAAIQVLSAPPAPALALAHDSGASAVDGITADGSVQLTLDAGAIGWEYRTSAGGAWQAGSGTGITLAAGSYAAGAIQVRQVDAAGNLGAAGSNAHAIAVDATAPAATAVLRPALFGPSGNASFTVEVHYVDAGAGIDAASIDAADLTVSGAAGALQVSGAAWDAATGTATYTVDAPAGGWNPAAHAGSYAIGLTADAVKDLAGNALLPGAPTAFQVSFNAAPQITSDGGGAGAAIEIPEHRTAVTTVAALDADAGDTLAYSITGGQDAALFAIDAATGALSLRSAPSVASPQDGDGNNTYLVQVGASDGHGGLATQALAVTVLRDTDGDGQADIADDDLDGDGRLNAAEDPVPSAHGSGSGDGNGDGIPDSRQVNVASLATVGSVAPALRYATIEVAPGLTLSSIGNSVAGNLPRNAKMPLGQFDFTIDGLTVGASVDVALYVDKSLGANGYYKLVGSTWTNLATTSTVGSKTMISFTLTDGGIYDADGVANGRIVDPGGVAVIAPKIVSAGGDPSATVQVHENQTAVTTVAAEAVDTVQYAITGGSDAALFTLDPVSGKLAFAAAPDYERPLDLGDGAADNSYLVEVTASDAAGSDTQRLRVEVLDVDEIPCPDADGDQFPDLLEATHGLTAGARDNDVFASNKLFVMELYRDLLFREAAAPEWQYWQNMLDAGRLDKTALVSVFLDAAEFQGGAGAVARLYYGALERAPDRAGLVYWTQQLSGGEALRTVAGDIAGSAEFTARYGALDSAGFVDQLYRNVLGRPADKAGLAYWDSALAAGTSRGEVLLGFAQSAEFKAASDHEVTTALGYLGLLGRDAAPAEMAYWVGQLDAGQAEAKVVGRFLEVDEYHDRFLPHVVM